MREPHLQYVAGRAGAFRVTISVVAHIGPSVSLRTRPLEVTRWAGSVLTASIPCVGEVGAEA